MNTPRAAIHLEMIKTVGIRRPELFWRTRSIQLTTLPCPQTQTQVLPLPFVPVALHRGAINRHEAALASGPQLRRRVGLRVMCLRGVTHLRVRDYETVCKVRG